MALDIIDMRRKAERATPGPWQWTEDVYLMRRQKRLGRKTLAISEYSDLPAIILQGSNDKIREMGNLPRDAAESGLMDVTENRVMFVPYLMLRGSVRKEWNPVRPEDKAYIEMANPQVVKLLVNTILEPEKSMISEYILRSLEAKALAATPGPWRWISQEEQATEILSRRMKVDTTNENISKLTPAEYKLTSFMLIQNREGRDIFRIPVVDMKAAYQYGFISTFPRDTDGEFIASANPANILAMIRHIRKMYQEDKVKFVTQMPPVGEYGFFGGDDLVADIVYLWLEVFGTEPVTVKNLMASGNEFLNKALMKLKEGEVNTRVVGHFLLHNKGKNIGGYVITEGKMSRGIKKWMLKKEKKQKQRLVEVKPIKQ